MTSEWIKVGAASYVPMHRDGWAGAWDAVKAAITGRPRLTLEKPVTISCWVKTAGVTGPAAFFFNGVQMEFIGSWRSLKNTRC